MIKKKHIIFLSIIILSLFFRVIYWYNNPVLSRDSCLYLQLAETWAERNDFQDILNIWESFWIPPLPLYMIKSIMSFGVSSHAAGLGINVFFGTVLPLIMYQIAKEISHDTLFSISASFLTIIHPILNELSVQIQRDILYLFFSGLIIYLFILFIRLKKTRFLLYIGFLCACNILTRYEALELIIFLPVLLGLSCAFKKMTLKKTFSGLILFNISFLSTIFLFVVVSGTSLSLTRYYNTYISYRYHAVTDFLPL